MVKHNENIIVCFRLNSEWRTNISSRSKLNFSLIELKIDFSVHFFPVRTIYQLIVNGQNNFHTPICRGKYNISFKYKREVLYFCEMSLK